MELAREVLANIPYHLHSCEVKLISFIGDSPADISALVRHLSKGADVDGSSFSSSDTRDSYDARIGDYYPKESVPSLKLPTAVKLSNSLLAPFSTIAELHKVSVGSSTKKNTPPYMPMKNVQITNEIEGEDCSEPYVLCFRQNGSFGSGSTLMSAWALLPCFLPFTCATVWCFRCDDIPQSLVLDIIKYKPSDINDTRMPTNIISTSLNARLTSALCAILHPLYATTRVAAVAEASMSTSSTYNPRRVLTLAFSSSVMLYSNINNAKEKNRIETLMVNLLTTIIANNSKRHAVFGTISCYFSNISVVFSAITDDECSIKGRGLARDTVSDICQKQLLYHCGTSAAAVNDMGPHFDYTSFATLSSVYADVLQSCTLHSLQQVPFVRNVNYSGALIGGTSCTIIAPSLASAIQNLCNNKGAKTHSVDSECAAHRKLRLVVEECALEDSLDELRRRAYILARECGNGGPIDCDKVSVSMNEVFSRGSVGLSSSCSTDNELKGLGGPPDITTRNNNISAFNSLIANIDAHMLSNMSDDMRQRFSELAVSQIKAIYDEIIRERKDSKISVIKEEIQTTAYALLAEADSALAALS